MTTAILFRISATLLLLILIPVANVYASHQNYLPLAVGNSWTYRNHYDSSTITFTITRAELINGCVYYVFNDYYDVLIPPDIHRVTEGKEVFMRYDPVTDRILKLESSNEVVRYDFSGNGWSIDMPGGGINILDDNDRSAPPLRLASEGSDTLTLKWYSSPAQQSRIWESSNLQTGSVLLDWQWQPNDRLFFTHQMLISGIGSKYFIVETQLADTDYLKFKFALTLCGPGTASYSEYLAPGIGVVRYTQPSGGYWICGTTSEGDDALYILESYTIVGP